MPCFGPDGYGTYYSFKQGDILPYLSADVRRYFLSVLERHAGSDWMAILKEDPNPQVLAEQNQAMRNMWSTAEFFHIAGLGIDSGGNIKPLTELGKDSIYDFEPIRIKCDESGNVEWDSDPTAHNRFIFHILDRDHYASAMTQSLKTLLHDLP